jgi:hypothetical protein
MYPAGTHVSDLAKSEVGSHGMSHYMQGSISRYQPVVDMEVVRPLAVHI